MSKISAVMVRYYRKLTVHVKNARNTPKRPEIRLVQQISVKRGIDLRRTVHAHHAKITWLPSQIASQRSANNHSAKKARQN